VQNTKSTISLCSTATAQEQSVQQRHIYQLKLNPQSTQQHYSSSHFSHRIKRFNHPPHDEMRASPHQHRSAARRFAITVSTIFLLAMHHVSLVQAFVNQSNCKNNLASHFRSQQYGYSQLESKRHLSIPFHRLNLHNKMKHVTSVDLSNRRSSRISRLASSVSHLIPSRKRSVLDKKSVEQTKSSRKYRTLWLAFASLAFGLIARPTLALAMGAMGGASKGPVAPVSKKDALTLFGVFFSLFAGLALLHAAEIAITTLYPWKVREFAEDVSTIRRSDCRRVSSTY
jgi:hypothetical protein